MKPLRCLIAACAMIAVVSAQDLSLPELARRPELWPVQVTLKQPVKLQGRAPIAAGQKLNVISMRGDSVEVETPDGRGTFDVKAANTDVLATAGDTWQKLTPKQRALTLAQVLQKKELWPYRVKLTLTQQLNTGPLRPGESLILIGTEGSRLLVASEKLKTMFDVEPRETDLIDSARKLVENKEALPGRITEDLAGKMTNPSTGAPAPLEANAQPVYYAFYRGASWCGPCRQFSPTLVKFYNENKAKHPHFEVIYISGDKSAAEMRGYAKEAGFSWRAVVSERQPQMQLVNRLFTELIPALVVTDRAGNVLIDSAKSNTATALKQLEALVKKPAS